VNGSYYLAAGSQTITQDPQLGPLQDNGGYTKTLAFNIFSPAYNAGDSTLVPAGLSTDQRGPGFARVVSGQLDLGAFEIQHRITLIPTTTTLTGPTNSVYGHTVTFTATVSINQPGKFDLTGGKVEFYSQNSLIFLGATPAGTATSSAQALIAFPYFPEPTLLGTATLVRVGNKYQATLRLHASVHGMHMPDAGTYSVTAHYDGSLATGWTPSTSKPITWKVTPAHLTVRALSYSETAGNPSTDPKSFGVSVGPFVPGDSLASIGYPNFQVDVSPNPTSTRVVGYSLQGITVATTYALNVKQGTVWSSDYVFDYVPGTLTVYKTVPFGSLPLSLTLGMG
jgi:hypothetical protein